MQTLLKLLLDTKLLIIIISKMCSNMHLDEIIYIYIYLFFLPTARRILSKMHLITDWFYLSKPKVGYIGRI